MSVAIRGNKNGQHEDTKKRCDTASRGNQKGSFISLTAATIPKKRKMIRYNIKSIVIWIVLFQ